MEEKKKEKGFVKIHVAVNTKTRKIVSMEVTKENAHDGKMLKKLVEDAASEKNNIQKVLADGAYDSKYNFRYLDELKITQVIKAIRIHPLGIMPDCMPRKPSVLEQLKDVKRWRKKHTYGMRWMAESAFSSIKRMFGEHVSAVKWNNIVNELMLKASIYKICLYYNDIK
jgi:hypothetical protein